MKKKLVAIMIIIIVTMNITCASFATSITDLQNKRNEVQTQKNEAEEQLENVQTQKSQTMEEIEELSSKINENEDKLAELRKEIEELEANIKQKEEEIRIAQETYDKNKELLDKRLIAIHESAETTYLDVLLNSKSLTDFISKWFTVQELAEHDTELLNSIEQEKTNIQTQKEELDRQKVNVKSKKAEQEKANTILKNAKAQKNSKVAKLSDEEKALQEKIDQFNVAIRETETTIQQAIANSNSWNNTGSGAGANKPLTGGILEWPLPANYATYSRITSYFGPRKQPTAGASTNHGAIDIGIPLGTPVYSAELGTVIMASWDGGYGNFVMIKHDNGLYTAYAHLSGYNVNVGQRVSRGQQIATSGSTGISTGPHLHFEVRLSPGGSSNRGDPLDYLTI